MTHRGFGWGLGDALGPVVARDEGRAEGAQRSPGVVVGGPEQGAARGQHLFRGAEVVGDNVGQRPALKPGQRAEGTGFKEPVDGGPVALRLRQLGRFT